MALIIPHSIQAQTWTGRQKAIKQNSATSKKKTTAFGKGSTKNKVHATTVSEATGFVGRNGYVDLSLPSGTLWARCNLGDVFPNSFGHRYSW